MRLSKPPNRLLLAGALILAASQAHADGGYWAGNKGARAAGRAGAFTAKADDLMAVAYNPAGLAKLGGTTLQIGNRFSYNWYAYRRQPTLDWGNPTDTIPPYVEFPRVENDKPWQALDPLVGVGTNFGLEGWGFALVAYAPPGISQEEFPVDAGQRYMMVRRKAEIIDYNASAAWQYRDVFGVGASLQWIYLRRLDYQLVIDGGVFRGEANPVSSQYDIVSSVSGSDPFTFNAVLGAWVRAAPFLEFGLAGQVVPTSWKTNSTLSVDPLVVDEVELTREGRSANDVTLELPLPLMARLGARYVERDDVRELYDVELDVVYETWSRVENFTLDSNGILANVDGQTVDVGRIEIEKHWQDTLGVHLGGDYVVVPDLFTARAGAYFESAVAKPEYAHVDFTSGKQLGATLGASLFFGRAELALGYEYRHQPEVRVTETQGAVYQEAPGSYCVPPYTDPNLCHPEYLGQPSPTVNGGSYRAHSHMASLDLLYRF